MKQTLTIIAAIALGAFSFLQAQPPGGPHGGWHSNPLEEMTLRSLMSEFGLDATPIFMAGGVWCLREWADWIDNPEIGPVAFQFGTRPLLTQEQQTKLDGIVKAHEDMHNAMKELHDAKAK